MSAKLNKLQNRIAEYKTNIHTKNLEYTIACLYVNTAEPYECNEEIYLSCFKCSEKLLYCVFYDCSIMFPMMFDRSIIFFKIYTVFIKAVTI